MTARHIFINYRRSDDAAAALLLKYKLENLFPNQIFIDQEENFIPGKKFPPVIERRLQECRVMLVLVGSNWLEIFKERRHSTNDNDHDDWVRKEISTALKRNIPVIPILINQTTVPDKWQLPIDLHELFDCQVSHFNYTISKYLATDLNDIKEAIHHHLTDTPESDAHQARAEDDARLGGVKSEVQPVEQDLRDRVKTPPRLTTPHKKSQLYWASSQSTDLISLWADVEINGVTQRMRWIEPGLFRMGCDRLQTTGPDSSSPSHTVHITQGFWMADTQCTQSFWHAVVNSKSVTSSSRTAPDIPITAVSWHDVSENFIKKLQDRLDVRVDLPTEAEWEYACRAGKTSTPETQEPVTRATMNCGNWYRDVKPVKTFEPNSWGLFQMHGNVWEWCRDGWRQYFDTKHIDPEGDVRGRLRALRGGSWETPPHRAASAAHRRYATLDLRSPDCGFRFVIRFPNERSDR